MSDITGPPLPAGLKPVVHADKPNAVSRDSDKPPTSNREDRADHKSQTDQQDAAKVRDPAVSISATAAHIQVGDQLKQQVAKFDIEGRPIIVTDFATFALRPDAGLRAGDDVVLEIVEAGKSVAADLRVRNGHVIDPPVRLSLIVIAIHLPDGRTSVPPQALEQGLPPATYGKYGPSSVITRQGEPESVASVLGARSHPSDVHPDARLADNPDPRLTHTNSQDLATLIAAQQGRVSSQTPSQVSPTTALLTPEDRAQSVGHRLIAPSDLTALQAANAETTGVGQAVRAFALDGSEKRLEPLDARVSRVPPNQVAEVLAVRPLPLDEARTLPLPVAAFAGGSVALARIETDKGVFIAPLEKAGPLSGELVRLSAVQAAAAPRAPEPAVTYSAKLTPPDSASTKNVKVAVPDQPSAQNIPQAEQAAIKAVHTIRAFLSQHGPMSDLKLETTRGILTLTLPNEIRPLVGDILRIVPDVPALQAQPQTAAAQPSAAAPALEPLPAIALTQSAWPALGHAIASLTATAPDAAAGLSARSADGGAKLTNSLMFFLQAAGRGNPDAWVGDAQLAALERRDPHGADLLRESVARLMSVASDGGPEGRLIALPFDIRGADAPLVAMLFGYPPEADHRGGGQPGQDNGKADKPAERFLVEVQFSILGAVQLDGQIRDREFDLTIRTEKRLPPSLKQDAYILFDDALAASAFTGRLRVVEAEPFPVVLQAMLAEKLGTQGDAQLT